MIKKVLHFTSNDPHKNLVAEESIFRNHSESEMTLLFYINRPTVVLGRFQNPWVELDLNALKKERITLARRQSGGGAVYHDRFNLNWSIISPRPLFNLNDNNQIILDSLKSFDIDVTVGPRHGFYVGEKKISGVAFKEIKHTKYHHGTLLVKSDLNILNRVLKQRQDIESKSIRSVSSPVVNLTDLNSEITLENLTKRIAKFFSGSDSYEEFDNRDVDSTHYESLNWVYGETPYFKITKEGSYLGEKYSLLLSVLKGKIVEVRLLSDALHPEHILDIEHDLKNQLIYQDNVSWNEEINYFLHEALK